MSLTLKKSLGGFAPSHFSLLVPAFALALSLLPTHAYAAKTVSVANPEYEEALNRLNSLSDEYNALTSQMDQTLSQMEDVQSQITRNERQVEEVQKKIDDSSATLTSKQSALAAHIADNYKSGGVSLLSILLSSTSLEDAISKLHYHSSIVKAESSEIANINTMKAELQSKQVELQQLKEDLLAQQADINGLYEQQHLQADEMFDRQLQQAQLIESLPKEILETLEDDPEELINESQAVLAASDKGNQSEEGQKNNAGSKSASEGTKPSDSDKQNESSEDKITATPTATEDVIQKTEPTKTEESSLSTEGPYVQGGAQKIVDTAYATGPTREDWGCAGWVYIVFRDAGIYDKKPTCAAWYYNNWCTSSDLNDLKPGMVIAVSTWTGTAAGKIYGHVGIYVGNNTVRQYGRSVVRDVPVDKWIKQYSTTVTPRWGWNGGIVLS